jgi:hypothetical protein
LKHLNHINSEIENLQSNLNDLLERKRIYQENPLLALEEEIQMIRFLKDVSSKDIIQTIIQYLNEQPGTNQQDQAPHSI